MELWEYRTLHIEDFEQRAGRFSNGHMRGRREPYSLGADADLDRPRFGKFQAHWYDLAEAQHNYETLDGGIPNIALVLINRFKMFNQEQAKQRNLANQAENNIWNAGGGTIVIIGEPNAMSGSTATVVGARQGIDGDYRIETATHILVRDQGYLTELECRTRGRRRHGTVSRSAVPGRAANSHAIMTP